MDESSHVRNLKCTSQKQTDEDVEKKKKKKKADKKVAETWHTYENQFKFRFRESTKCAKCSQ